MKSQVLIQRGDYGFGHNWTLKCETPKITKTFWLGQDVKFCHRVLGMDTDYVASCIRTRNISEGTIGNRKLARFICRELNLNGNNIKRMNGWDLACQ